MDNKLLPNGSIILLEDGKIKLMIYGRKQILVTEDDNNGTMYDYLAVPYPEGYISPDYTYVFNHANIAEVIFKGFTNEEEVEFQNILVKA